VIINVQLHAKQFLPKLESNGTLKDKFNMIQVKLKGSLDDNLEEYQDWATAEACQFLLEHLKDADNSMNIKDYFHRLYLEDSNFCYRFRLDGRGNPIGFTWQSSVQQAALRIMATASLLMQ